MSRTSVLKTVCYFVRRSAPRGTLRYLEHRSPCKRGCVMRVFLAAIFVIAASLPATGQGKFIGVDDDPSIGVANAKVLIIEFGDYQCTSSRMFWRQVGRRRK